jgi:hypothetical protein
MAINPTSANLFKDYADLINDFQELTAAAVNRHGQGLQTYRLGRDLSPAHRDLLNDVRKILIDGLPRSPADKRQSAAADWRRISAKLQESLDEARKLNISGGGIAAAADDIPLIGEVYLGISPNGPSQMASGAAYKDALVAVKNLLDEFDKMSEASLDTQRESVQGRPDATVNMATREINTRRREGLQAVKLGDHTLKRHRAVIEKLRQAMLLARSEAPGSAYKALTLWNSIRTEMARVIEWAPTFVETDAGEFTRRLSNFGGVLAKHYELVHTETLATALKAPPRPGEAEADRALAAAGAKEALANVQEQRMLDRFRYVLNIVEHGITPVQGRPGEWLLTAGAVQVRLRDDQVKQLRAIVAGQLNDYMNGLANAMAYAAVNYDSIKQGNSSFKLHVLGGWGGASDPGSQDNYKMSAIRVRKEIISPMVARGEYLKAFGMILIQKAVIERQVKEVADYEHDLDVGYSRLARSMQVLEVALTSLVPIAGEAALAKAGLLAVGGTAVASGTVAPVIVEGARELVSGEGLQADKLLSTGRQGLAISSGALAGPASKALGGVLGASQPGVTGLIAETAATGTVGGTQSVIGGGSFGEGFVGAGVTHLGTRAVTGAGVKGPAGTTAGSAGAGALGAWVSGGDPLAGAAGGAVSNVGSHITRTRAAGAGLEAVPVHVEHDPAYHGLAPDDGVPVHMGHDPAYHGPVPGDGVPVHPGLDAANYGPAMTRRAKDGLAESSRDFVSGADTPSQIEGRLPAHVRSNLVNRGNAYGYHGATYAAQIEAVADYVAQRGAKEIHIVTNAHGVSNESGFVITDRNAGNFFAEDAKTQGIIQHRYPGTQMILHDALDAVQFEAFKQAQARAISGEPGVATIAAFCDSVGLFPEDGVPRIAFPPGGAPGARGGSGMTPKTPIRETRVLISGNRFFHTSEAELRAAVAGALQTAKANEKTQSKEWSDAQAERVTLFTELRAIDPQLADKARRYYEEIDKPKFLEDQMVFLWKEAAAHGRTTAGELEHILGGGKVNEFNPPESSKEKDKLFQEALRDPRPIVDLRNASDHHGSHTHMFHEFLGDRLFGPGAGRDFRLRLATLEWDKWPRVWDVLFDESIQVASLHCPEVLGEILQIHLDFPRFNRPEP